MTPKRQTGIYVRTATAGKTVEAFVPRPLPPDPPLELSAGDLDLLEKANRALGRLDGLSGLLPETSLFVYVKKEAVLSSQIEGTQSSLSDLLLYESEQAPGVPLEDVREVSNYVAAIDHGLERLHGGFPLSLRLIREIHGILLAQGRGSDKVPGEFRRSQNWIGGTRPGNARFVPPPPERVMECMGALEKFLHDQPVLTPTLIKAALAHAQFLPGRQRPARPFADHPAALRREGARRADPLSELVLQDAPGRILRAPATGSPRRRLGRLAALLPARGLSTLISLSVSLLPEVGAVSVSTLFATVV